MKIKKVKERKEARIELEKGIHLVKAPTALAKDPSLTLPKKVGEKEEGTMEGAMEREKVRVKVRVGRQAVRETDDAMQE